MFALVFLSSGAKCVHCKLQYSSSTTIYSTFLAFRWIPALGNCTFFTEILKGQVVSCTSTVETTDHPANSSLYSSALSIFQECSFESCDASSSVLYAQETKQLLSDQQKDILLIFIKQAHLDEGRQCSVQRFGALVSGRSRNLPAPLTTPKYTTVHCHQHQPPRD
jgi:hypothetical protein